MKNSNISKYLDQARKKASQNFANADGNFSGGTNFTQGFGNATGAMDRVAPTSQPYVINITNASGSAVANFSVLGANEVLGSGRWDDAGNYIKDGVTVSSGTPGISYKSMLFQFQQKPFTVGLTYVQSATANQVLQVFSIVTKDANGNQQSRPIVPTISPYQFQAGIVPVNMQYEVEGFTSIVFASILASATITVQLYPVDKIDLAAGLGGGSVAKTYSDPNVAKAGEITLK